jgi:hypothetical protein
MKNGLYKISFEVKLVGCETEEDAHKALIGLLVDSIEGNAEFPEVDFALTEEIEEEYEMEEEEIEPLNFEETA